MAQDQEKEEKSESEDSKSNNIDLIRYSKKHEGESDDSEADLHLAHI